MHAMQRIGLTLFHFYSCLLFLRVNYGVLPFFLQSLSTALTIAVATRSRSIARHDQHCTVPPKGKAALSITVDSKTPDY